MGSFMGKTRWCVLRPPAVLSFFADEACQTLKEGSYNVGGGCVSRAGNTLTVSGVPLHGGLPRTSACVLKFKLADADLTGLWDIALQHAASALGVSPSVQLCESSKLEKHASEDLSSSAQSARDTKDSPRWGRGSQQTSQEKQDTEDSVVKLPSGLVCWEPPGDASYSELSSPESSFTKGEPHSELSSPDSSFTKGEASSSGLSSPDSSFTKRHDSSIGSSGARRSRVKFTSDSGRFQGSFDYTPKIRSLPLKSALKPGSLTTDYRVMQHLDSDRTTVHGILATHVTQEQALALDNAVAALNAQAIATTFPSSTTCSALTAISYTFAPPPCLTPLRPPPQRAGPRT